MRTVVGLLQSNRLVRVDEVRALHADMIPISIDDRERGRIEKPAAWTPDVQEDAPTGQSWKFFFRTFCTPLDLPIHLPGSLTPADFPAPGDRLAEKLGFRARDRVRFAVTLFEPTPLNRAIQDVEWRQRFTLQNHA